MATNRRKSHTRRDDLITDGLWQYLAGDTEVMKTDVELRFFTTDEELQVAWEQNRVEVLTQWIKEHPGTRLVCWWKYDAPREYQLEGTEIHFAMRKQLTGTAIDMSTRLPEVICGLPQNAEGCTFESEAEFLERHNLLTDDERKLHEPVRWYPLKYEVTRETR